MNYLDRLLLDSTYLLPIVGVDVKGVEKVILILKELHNSKGVKYYYTPFNIIEIIGKLSKTTYNPDRVYTGLTSIREEFNLAYPTINGYLKALKLRSLGFKDLIDLLLYTTSLSNNIPFLTRDEDLIKFLTVHGERIDNIIFERDFVKNFSNSLIK